MSPKHAYKRYLSGIFTRGLAIGRWWVRTWARQILSAVVWLQTALLSAYRRADSMRAAHRASHKAVSAEPHFFVSNGKSSVYGIALPPERQVGDSGLTCKYGLGSTCIGRGTSTCP